MIKKFIRIEQVGSPIRRQDYQLKCLKGLGLGKMHRIRDVEDTPSVQGMVRRVQHLLKIHTI